MYIHLVSWFLQLTVPMVHHCPKVMATFTSTTFGASSSSAKVQSGGPVIEEALHMISGYFWWYPDMVSKTGDPPIFGWLTLENPWKILLQHGWFLGSPHSWNTCQRDGANKLWTSSSWWFGTWMLFYHSVGNVIIPTDCIIFFRGF